MFKKKHLAPMKPSKHDAAIKRGTIGNSLFRFDNTARASERANEREREKKRKRKRGKGNGRGVLCWRRANRIKAASKAGWIYNYISLYYRVKITG